MVARPVISEVGSSKAIVLHSLLLKQTRVGVAKLVHGGTLAKVTNVSIIDATDRHSTSLGKRRSMRFKLLTPVSSIIHLWRS